jgi:hypothetical protein
MQNGARWAGRQHIPGPGDHGPKILRRWSFPHGFVRLVRHVALNRRPSTCARGQNLSDGPVADGALGLEYLSGGYDRGTEARPLRPDRDRCGCLFEGRGLVVEQRLRAVAQFGGGPARSTDTHFALCAPIAARATRRRDPCRGRGSAVVGCRDRSLACVPPQRLSREWPLHERFPSRSPVNS